MAALADEVMVMALAAQPVAGLARVVRQRIDRTALAERRERPVDRGQADAVSGAGQRRVDLLRRRVVLLCGENPEHREPLARGPKVVPPEKRDVVGLRSGLHFAYASGT